MSFRILYSIINLFCFSIERLYATSLSDSPVIFISSSLVLGLERAFLIITEALSFAGHTNPFNN